MEKSNPKMQQREELLAGQVTLLYDQGPVGLFGTILSAAFYTYITWDILPRETLTAWFFLMLVITGARTALEYFYKKKRPEAAQAQRWGAYFTIGTFFSGAAWGLAALLLFPEESFAHQVFLAFLIGGLSTGTIATYTSLKWTSPLFSTPPMLVLIGKFLSAGGEINYAVGITIFVFLLMMISTSLRVHATTLSSLKLRFINLELLDSIETERAWFKQLSEATFEGILVHDHGIIISANDNLCKMFGYTLEEVIGLNALELLVPEGRDKAMKRIIEQSEVPDETIGLKRDGTQFPIEVQGRAIPHKGKNARIAAIHDLSVQKKAEKELALALEETENIINANPDLIYVFNIRSELVKWNRGMEIFKGFDKERLTKLPATELVAESDRPYLEKKIKTIFEHGEITFEANLIGKDGKPYPYFCNGILLKNDLDDPVGFTGTARNIAKLKEIEKNLRLSKERAEKATKEKDKFISLLSHDLRSPLGAINGLAGILLKPKEHNLKKEDSAEISQRIKGMADGLVNMIDRLLDISRLTIGTVKPVKKSYDLRIFAAIQIGRISHMLQNKEITISNEIPEHINVFFDDRLFGEVLLNVFSNAVKFSNRGGSISVRQCENISEEKITIAIEDSGVGINELRLKDIFKPEIKTNTLGTEGETGTGLGLPYCDDIMKAHKGNIRAESVEGKGSVFHIELPVSEMVIVIADDQEVQRDLLQTAILNKLNAEVLEASNGIEALKIVKETSPDLLITDIEMPEMDGFDLIREIRNNSETDGLPILVNSSLLDGAAGDKDSGEGIRAKVLKLGANAYFQKPFIPEELIAKINALL